MDHKTLGLRVAQARGERDVTQAKLGEMVGLERSAISRAEKGERRLTMAEMVAIAEALGRPLGFFVNDPLPAVVNRRRDLANAPEDARHDTTEALDTEIELFAADALMLLEMGLLAPVKRDREARTPQGHEEAEHLASAVRDSLGAGDEPILNLGQACEQLGLYTYAASLGTNGPDGGCVEVTADDESIAVAVINGDVDSGRRRMTLAHELGHWLCGDAYDAMAGADCEKMLFSFAIHFLAPRSGATRVWLDHADWNSRDRALAVAAVYHLSWSAAVNQLRNLGLIDWEEAKSLLHQEPRRGDYVHLKLTWAREPKSPYLSPGFSAACIEGYTSGQLTAARTIELLRDTMSPDELPERPVLSLDDLRRSFAGHGD
ncbi:Zn-dependent peptidase ImmA, M78 family [Mycolicibacterium rutilum]|uniref:Zn-dependent peptidase ImmA, M78 family n=1 Tax=Mycolicibacterium rutilum TaxID=370526 RepID=A0A1H6LBM0_MYCRU|nr:XRE family transcriptional regulator [Mycolicibacterium rutilum]SEH83391.1 Zn-dependent peptidase ImmA, M78 family [Mycolicibacterium rutilum]